jgi:hypothetical protein
MELGPLSQKRHGIKIVKNNMPNLSKLYTTNVSHYAPSHSITGGSIWNLVTVFLSNVFVWVKLFSIICQVLLELLPSAVVCWLARERITNLSG